MWLGWGENLQTPVIREVGKVEPTHRTEPDIESSGDTGLSKPQRPGQPA